jgi:hypothetical protein
MLYILPTENTAYLNKNDSIFEAHFTYRKCPILILKIFICILGAS